MHFFKLLALSHVDSHDDILSSPVQNCPRT
jgi:hypothetical protein